MDFLFSCVEFVYIYSAQKLLACVGKLKGLYLYFLDISKVNADTSTAHRCDTSDTHSVPLEKIPNGTSGTDRGPGETEL